MSNYSVLCYHNVKHHYTDTVDCKHYFVIGKEKFVYFVQYLVTDTEPLVSIHQSNTHPSSLYEVTNEYKLGGDIQTTNEIKEVIHQFLDKYYN